MRCTENGTLYSHSNAHLAGLFDGGGITFGGHVLSSPAEPVHLKGLGIHGGAGGALARRTA